MHHNRLDLLRRLVSHRHPPITFGKLQLTSSFGRDNNLQFTPRTNVGNNALAASNDDENEQQKGMEEAFASLEELSTEDLDSESKDVDRGDVPPVKYSRTDDTPASDSGKSTTEEVETYLEMQGELDGTATSQDAELKEGEEDNPQLEFNIDNVEVVEEPEEEEEFPWTSINPILRLRGPVATGYGRGGKQLGVPTANLPASLFQSALEDISNGVYFGWGVIEQHDKDGIKKGRNKPIKAVVNVGYSPTFEGKENKEKIAEAHLLTKDSPMAKNELADTAAITDDETELPTEDDTEIEGDFYGETMRLQLIGYLRPEQKFDSFPELIAQIHRDIGNADWALDSMPFVFSKEDEFVKDGGESDDWVGSGGGDGVASWEFEPW